ncbi:urokinase plasminogen activator surface receptor-like [Pelodiscus sinensis]|uniref:urokinase plasminogen activator surface receptor-like n=1 Tax=Pelodiscus sinensis TaxID=13735 RepID=UPI003F6D8EA2
MARGLALIPLLALLAPGCGLRCKSCRGELGCPEEVEVTCGPGETSCRTAVRSAAVTFLRFQTVSKGCARHARPDEALALSSHLLALSYRARHCQGDACNAASLAPEPATPNQLRCHACTSQGAWCPLSARTQLGCTGSQDQCLDLDVTGTLGEFANTKLKGCASLSRCQDGLGFHSSSRAIQARCCSTPLCNHQDTDFHTEAKLHNGLQCYSCADEDEIGCTVSSMTTMSCVGQHNMCLEGIGRSHSGGAGSVLVTFKGCATPAMCQSSLLALVQELDDAEVFCCTGSLCNTRIMNGHVAEGWPGASPPAPARTTTPSGIPKPVAGKDVALVAGGAGGHGDREAATTRSSEGRWYHAAPPSGRQDVTPHPGRLATGGHEAITPVGQNRSFSQGWAGSSGGQNKTLGTKPLAVAPAGGQASRGTARPEGRWERIEGDRDWPSISFPITVETPSDALRGARDNASTPGPEPKGPVTNAGGSVYTRPRAPQTPRLPAPSGAFRLRGSLSLPCLLLLLAALLP